MGDLAETLIIKALRDELQEKGLLVTSCSISSIILPKPRKLQARKNEYKYLKSKTKISKSFSVVAIFSNFHMFHKCRGILVTLKETFPKSSKSTVCPEQSHPPLISL
jgi:hypothetical protein